MSEHRKQLFQLKKLHK